MALEAGPLQMPVLEIEDHDELYRRIHRTQFSRDGEVTPAAFITNWRPDNQVSVDLARLTTPDETLKRGPQDVTHYGLGVLIAGYPRSLAFVVRHFPSPANYAHSLIEGGNSRKKCLLLAEHTKPIRYPGGQGTSMRSPSGKTA